jgi:serine/threonine protein kinase
MASLVGQTISHFQITAKLGEGGMGVVYEAKDLALNRIVALKFLPHGVETDEPERARFLQEARAAAALNHPNICTIYEIAEVEGQQFIVMEFVEGKTLREIVPVKKMQDGITYAIQIAEALQEAHTHGIVHRDIKAENIMVNSKNQVKVMDFGLAKLKGTLKLTKTSSTIGTLAYMAPEHIQGEEVDARSDIFSFGIVLYEMLTGHLPFRGEHEAAMVYSIVNEEPTPVQQYIPAISSEIVHIIDRALDKDPEDRYQSAHEMTIDLRRAKKESTRIVKPSASQGPASLTPETPRQISTASAARMNKRIWYIAGLALAAVAFAIAWKILLSGGQQSADSYPFQTFRLVRIATDARAMQAALSPDGRYIIYAANEPSGKQSVWMRQVSAASSVRILPPEDISWYSGFTFSPDGDRVYYSATTESTTRQALFVVPTLGGTPRKLSDNISGAVAVSPDEKQLAFIRQNQDEGEEVLMVCAPDGTSEHTLVSRRGEDFFVGAMGQAPAWSPDGKTIAVSAGSVTGKFYMSVLLVSVADGSSRLATSHRWEDVGRVVWVNDGRGVVLSAIEYLTGLSSQLWYVDLATGKVRRITTDLNSYDATSLSITADQSKLLALQQTFYSTITILPGGDLHRARQITSRSANGEGENGLDWTPGGQLVFGSLVSGNADIWMMDADGKNRHQLTTKPYYESSPSVSWDGQLITYVSTRDTTSHVWRMAIDGNNQEPLTTGILDDYSPRCAPDSRWIYFDSYRNKGRRNLWKVPPSGGDPIKVSDDDVYSAGRGISPDGRSIVVRFLLTAENKWRWAILSSANGTHTKEFDLPTTTSEQKVSWMPDGKAVAYIDTRNLVSNIWVLPLETMKAYQLTRFESELISDFAWSKDGKTLAVVRGELSSDVVLLTNAK